MSKSKEHLVVTPESPPETKLFYHEWVSYNPQNNKVAFTPEALVELQKLVDEIQVWFPTEEEWHKNSGGVHEVTKITQENANTTIDGMIVAGKSNTAIAKFLDRVSLILRWKKKWWDLKEVTKKVEKKVEKYGHSLRTNIMLHYSDWSELKSIPESMIIVRPWETLDVMIPSQQKRLDFAHIKK